MVPEKNKNIRTPFFWSISATLLIMIGWFLHGKFTYSKEIITTKRSCSLCKFMTVKRDSAWYEKQKRYTGGSSIEPVSFTSKKSDKEQDKTIVRHGILLINPHAKATVLICHGFMTSKDDMSIMRLLFNGFNIMTFDFRAHGEFIDDQCCTFGNDERHDVIAAAEFIKSHPRLKDKPLVVYGFSMGAVASILAQRERPDLFTCAVWDCPFDSTHQLIGRAIDRMKLSLFGYEFSVPGKSFLKKYAYHPYVQEMFKLAIKAVASMDATQINTKIGPVSPVEAVREIKIPTFFIACHNDEKAPPSAVLDIYKNARSVYKRCWIGTGKMHFGTLFANPEKYTYKINNFINLCLSGEYKNKTPQKVHEDPWVYQMVFGIK